jgi:misacylated tRNA(Ala) deacylase
LATMAEPLTRAMLANPITVDGRSFFQGPGPHRVALDRTAFYPTGGGQPHDTGTLAAAPVVDVRKEGEDVWHTLAGGSPVSAVGDEVEGEIDWERRHRLMRTHTALHVLCGVI